MQKARDKNDQSARGLVFSLLVLLLLLCVGCNNKNLEIKEELSQLSEAFESGDISAVSDIVFHEKGKHTELFARFMPSKEPNGILSQVFQRVSVEPVKIKRDYVSVRVVAPELSNIFLDYIALQQNMTADEFSIWVGAYIKNAKLEESTVDIPVRRDNQTAVIDYWCDDFTNAITGHLASAYHDIYQKAVAEYREVLGE